MSSREDCSSEPPAALLLKDDLQQQSQAPFASFLVAHSRVSARTVGKRGFVLAVIGFLHLVSLLAFGRKPQSRPKPTRPAILLHLPRLTPPKPRDVAVVAASKAAPAAPVRATHAAAAAPIEQPVAAAIAPVVEPEAAPVSDPNAQAEASGDSAGSSVGGGTGPVQSGGTATVMAPVGAANTRVLDPDERRRLLEQYLREIMSRSINQKRFYPAEAEEAGQQGSVVVRVVIDGAGRLQSATVIAGGHMPILAHAAVKTIQLAQPFPAPPEILGGRVQVDVSLNYEMP